MEKKQALSIRLTPEAKRILQALAQASGVTMTARLELLLREQGKREKIS